MHSILVGFEIVGHKVLIQDGSYTKERFWLKGEHHLQGCRYKFISGLQGPETVVTIETIKPLHIYTVELMEHDMRILERRAA